MVKFNVIVIHNEMITMEYIECPFCEQQLQEISVNHCPRYDIYLYQSMINDNGTHICGTHICICGTVNNYQIAKINTRL